MTTEHPVVALMEAQRAYFATGRTLDVGFRIAALKRLQAAIQRREAEIEAALTQDLGKSAFEGYMCEVGLTLAELRHQISHVRKWAKPRRVMPDLANFHSTYRLVQEPYGVVLVMSPWNYPFMLSLEPLIGAVAAGNCCVVKPSAYSPATSQIIAELVDEVFDRGHVDVVQGGRAENTALLEQRWDYVFFTGSPSVGKLVMEKASRFLTPVSLELGGKSPCIICKDADLKLAATRLAFGKWLNVSQTCVAPDYVLCHADVHDRFVELLQQAVETMYGSNALDNPDYGRIVNRKHFDRILGLVDPDKVAFCAGPEGYADPDTLRIAPVVMTGVTDQDAVMQEEIFGPVLPILKVQDEIEAEAFVKSHEKPLALYLFSNSKALQKRFMERVPFGGGCINDTIVHLATSNMGFGGVGNSGMGSYHGIRSFRTFSHEKSTLQKHNWIDLPMRYQPYADWKAKVIRLFLR
ncbi:MAG: aldehyde dehydrogenase [Coriobacteriia bacterium]|nr:aldehyde dehydrogenase [Coriobacteriia bacterium]